MSHSNSPATSHISAPHPILRIVLPAAILALGIGVAIVLLKTRRPPRKGPARERVTVVDVETLTRSRERIVLDAAGTVVPREAIPLQARVGGEIVAIDERFVPGGRFAQGDILLEIDPTDYRLTATNRLAELTRAQANLDMERGLQDVAASEWETMRQLDGERSYTASDQALALRAPQLKLAEAAVVSAQAALDRALLDIERTRVRAPFDAVVRERHVNVGAQIVPQTTLAQLAGSDAYWVRVTLPAEHMKWLHRAETTDAAHAVQATVRAVAGADPAAQWSGRVLQVLPDLEPQGRQAQLIVEVPQPRQPRQGNGALPLGAYVAVRIQGPTLDDVFRIPRRAVRDDRHIWLLTEESRLEIRDITLTWTDGKHALVRDHLTAGEQVIVSDISVPVAGMLLRRPRAAGAVSQGAGHE